MPASSKAQQKFMNVVHSVQKGDTKPSDVSQSVRDAAKSMSKKDTKDFADTPLKGLPNKVKQEIVKKLKEYANKMGLDHLGGDSIPSNKKRGGLRDFDGYDNVDYNRDMPQDESVNEASMDWEKNFKWANDKELKVISKFIFMNDRGIDGVIKMSKHKPFAFRRTIQKMAKKGLHEAKVETERYFGKKGIIIMIRDGNKMISAIFKDKKNADKFNRNKPADVKKLVQLAKKTKYPKAIDEGGLPQNWMSGRTSDYHTKLRGKRRNYDDTNFEKSNTGQPDIPEEEKDNEIVNEASFDKVIHLKLLNKAMRAMPGSQKQKEIIRKLNVVRKAGGMRPLKETAIEEYASRLTNAYILDDESILKGTPKPKDAINRESALKISRKNYSDWKKDNKNSIKEVGVFPIRNYIKGIIPKGRLDVTDRKSKERVKSLVRDLVSTLNHYWKSHNIPFRVRENVAPNHDGKSAPYGSGYKKVKEGASSAAQRAAIAISKKEKAGKPGYDKEGKSLKKEESKRDYKDEYKKFQSSTKAKKYRAELNKYNRDKGTYGNGDGKDASHKGGKIVGFESASKNRGRKEKSRLKKK